MNQNPEHGIALVTGAGSGIGQALVRQLATSGSQVIVSARSIEKARTIVASLPDPSSAFPFAIDVSKSASVYSARDAIAEKYGRIDLLINNAAAPFDYGARAIDARLSDIEGALDVNLLGAWRMIQAFLPLLRNSAKAKVLNISSGAGSFTDPAFGLAANPASIPGYATSKAALNALTVILAKELEPEGVQIYAVCPGLTASRPEMSNIPGARSVDEAARGILSFAAASPSGSSAGLFRDGVALGW